MKLIDYLNGIDNNQEVIFVGEGFEENKLDIMRYAQRQKYKQEPFRSKLLVTGDVYLEEGNWWGDKFWGVDIKTREGENNLGKIIMEVRSEIQG